MNNKLVTVVLMMIPVALIIYYLVASRQSGPDLSATPGGLSQFAGSQVASQAALPSSPSATPPTAAANDLLTTATPGATTFDANKVTLTIVKEGQGVGARKGDRLAVNYTGLLLSGQKFDASVVGQPFIFTLGKGDVIAGWDIGLLGMRVGEIRRLVIPAALAYGDKGNGPIPPSTPLMFFIELVKIN